MDIGVLRRDGRTDEFFDGAAAGRLMVRRCDTCARWFAPDASSCQGCGTTELSWAAADGSATLVSWALAHSRPAGDGTTTPPAIIGLVELAEGPWMHAGLDAPDVDRLREWMPLTVTFRHPEEGESYPVFSPSGQPGETRTTHQNDSQP